MIGGVRQTEGGTSLAATPGEIYSAERTSRVADLTLDEHGKATGTATVTYTGDVALHWRQDALKSDETSLKENLKRNMEATLPDGMEVGVLSVENLDGYDKPLTVKYHLEGDVASATGKRLAVPADVFESKAKARFPEPKRELPVDMRYPGMLQDAVRIRYPGTLALESVPTPQKAMIETIASYQTDAKPAANSITMYRNLINSRTIYLPQAYHDLRTFYTKVETADQETLVWKRTTPTTAVVAAAKNQNSEQTRNSPR